MFPRPRLTRRSFIRGLASIGGLGAAYSGMAAMDLMGRGALAQGNTTAPLPNGSLAGKRVVVIGAGLAGLCSGMRAARAGADVVILEATDRPGGRSLTLRNGDAYRETDWNSDTVAKFEQVGDVLPDDPDNYLNAGPGRIPQHHTRLLDYCRELGVRLQPYIYMDKANLMQNSAWNDGIPVPVRRLKNDLRGHLSEMMAKVPEHMLDEVVTPEDQQRFLEMLTHFGQLTQEGAQLIYAGAATKGDFVRAGYSVEPGDARQPGTPWPTLSFDEVMASDFWNSEMFNDLEYYWQTSLMEPVDGMDMIWKGFLKAKVGEGYLDTVESLIRTGQPVLGIDVGYEGATVRAVGGATYQADYVVASLAPPLLGRLDGNFLDAAMKETLQAVDMRHACKVGFQGRSRFWEHENHIYGGISWTKEIITQIWYPNYSFNSPTGVLTGAYNSGAAAEDFEKLNRETRVVKALEGGELLHPGYRDKVFAENGMTIAWAKMPYQAGGWAHDTAFTQPVIFDRLVNGDPLGGKVYMAGDWFSYWPGWQIGAVDSAHLATDLMVQKASAE